MKEKSKKIKSELIKDEIEISICKTIYFFDIIAEGEETILWKLKKGLELDTQVLKKGIYGKPLIVIDTCDDFTSAKEIFRNTLRKVNKGIKGWK